MMKTVQRKIWMRFLVLGVISVLFFNSSCKKEYIKVGYFYFVNDTNHQIIYEDLFTEYNLLPKSSVLIVQNQAGDKEHFLAEFYSPFLMKRNGPVNMKFDNNKCIMHKLNEDIHSVLDMKSFAAEKIDKFTFKFTYTFTEADYNRAVACP